MSLIQATVLLLSFSDSDQEPSNTQLYAGSSISAKNFNAMFLALKQKHNLSSQAVDSVLRLVKLCLPEGNKCPFLWISV